MKLKHDNTIIWIWLIQYSVSLGSTFFNGCVFLVGLVHYSRDLQILFSAKKTLKLGLTALFTHLKIILLQCFQFSVFNNKRYPNRPIIEFFTSPIVYLLILILGLLLISLALGPQRGAQNMSKEKNVDTFPSTYCTFYLWAMIFLP